MTRPLEAPMIMWGFPALICALVASALLLRCRPLLALAVTLAGSVARMAHQRYRRAPGWSWSSAERAGDLLPGGDMHPQSLGNWGSHG
jgi:hypothetical protein